MYVAGLRKPTTDMGFIGGPPDQFTEQQTIADDIPKEVPEGTFVINAPAVEFAGKEDIKQMLVKAYEMNVSSRYRCRNRQNCSSYKNT